MALTGPGVRIAAEVSVYVLYVPFCRGQRRLGSARAQRGGTQAGRDDRGQAGSHPGPARLAVRSGRPGLWRCRRGRLAGRIVSRPQLVAVGLAVAGLLLVQSDRSGWRRGDPVGNLLSQPPCCARRALFCSASGWRRPPPFRWPRSRPPLCTWASRSAAGGSWAPGSSSPPASWARWRPERRRPLVQALELCPLVMAKGFAPSALPFTQAGTRTHALA